MPRYLFRVRSGTMANYVGDMLLRGERDARHEALELAGTLLAKPTREFWHVERWAIDVTNEAEETLFTLTFFRSFETSVLAQTAVPNCLLNKTTSQPFRSRIGVN